MCLLIREMRLVTQQLVSETHLVRSNSQLLILNYELNYT